MTQETETRPPLALVAIRKIKKDLDITLVEAVNIAKNEGLIIHRLASGDKALEVSVLKTFTKAVNDYKETLQSNSKNPIINILIPQPKMSIRSRDLSPKRTIIFSGPTNSGKTYHGLEQLFEDYEKNPNQIHTYCGPLRLLAFEVYNKMKDKYGEDKVGFITGEEAINPEAKLLATTCEMAPEAGASILIDEAHWLADPERGDVWTKILISYNYDNFYILTAAEAEPIIETLMEDSEKIERFTFKRKTPLEFGGVMNLADIPARTAVVCFSRKSVYAVAQELQKKGKKVGVLYGALPLTVRKTQIQDYLDEVYDIMVTTDVIGHGINLPIDNVVFAQTEKFDGTEVRKLKTWEAAQIAGRAGRFGLSKKGQVFLAGGLPWFSDDSSLIKIAVAAAAGKIPTDLKIDKALISPTLNDLNILNEENPSKQMLLLLPTLWAWQSKAKELLKGRTLQPADLTTSLENATSILRYLNCPLENLPSKGTIKVNLKELSLVRALPMKKFWQLISGPFDVKLGFILQIAEWIIRQEDNKEDNYLSHVFAARVTKILKSISKVKEKDLPYYAEQLEEFTKIIGELRMVFVMFGTRKDGETCLGSLTLSEVNSASVETNNLITKALIHSMNRSSFGKCKNCGNPSAPWFEKCEKCFIEERTRNESRYIQV